jgi:signal transduction histidine kinase
MIPFVLIKLFSAVLSVTLGAGILARDHGLKSNRLIAAFLFCNAWWALIEFFLHQETDPEVAIWIFRLMSLGWMPLGVLCMHASVTLSSMEDHPVARMIWPLYAAIALVLPTAMSSDFVIAAVVKDGFAWQPIFGVGMVPAYCLLATPVIGTLACWRSVMVLPDSGGQLQLARIVFFGLAGSLVAGTLTAVVLPLLGLAAMGITTTLVALVGLAAAWTLRRYGYSLISSQAFAREILDTLKDGVVMVGEGDVLRDANRAFLRMVGASEVSAIGQPISNWILGFSDRASPCESSTFMDVRTRAGEIIPVVVSAPVDFHGPGRFVGQAFLLRDRREILALQRRIVGSARLAAVGDLAKSIARSINEPVARARNELEGLSIDWQTVEYIAELASLEAPCKEAISEGLELIGECAEGVERISSIVHEVGGFSSETAHADFVEASLSEIVSRSLRIAKVNAPPSLKIEVSLDSDVRIDCHSEEIERVVTNLLVNSIQAVEEDHPETGHIVVGVAAFGDRAVIHIEDDGSGITPEVLDRIFDPFFTTKPVGKGTGLGLAISYHIIKGHDGDIRVSSIPGRGTSVIVELPRAKVSQ